MKDDGTEAGEGEPGELYLKGPQVFLKYWRNEKASQDDRTPDGFLKTGDIAVTKNNEFWIVDRKKVSINFCHLFP
jgi:4-coumarate--CoA ligase